MLNPKAEALQAERLSRQSELVSSEIGELSVFIIGAGGIGSNFVHILVSMGVHDITIIDDDDVADENIHPSWFGDGHVGMKKVDALKQRVDSEYNITINTIDGRIEDMEPSSFFYDAIIVCTDTIGSRKYAYEHMGMMCEWWIDARMGGSGCGIYVIGEDNHEDKMRYVKDELRPVTSRLLCGEKATAYNTKGALPMFLGWIFRDISGGIHPQYYYGGLGGIEQSLTSDYRANK